MRPARRWSGASLIGIEHQKSLPASWGGLPSHSSFAFALGDCHSSRTLNAPAGERDKYEARNDDSRELLVHHALVLPHPPRNVGELNKTMVRAARAGCQPVRTWRSVAIKCLAGAKNCCLSSTRLHGGALQVSLEAVSQALDTRHQQAWGQSKDGRQYDTEAIGLQVEDQLELRCF